MARPDGGGARWTEYRLQRAHGHAGYLREAYHGGPYVTKYLMAEAFTHPERVAAIPAQTLRARLPAAVLMHMYREHKLYGDGKDPSRIDITDLKGPCATSA
jgi:hypothetical protein